MARIANQPAQNPGCPGRSAIELSLDDFDMRHRRQRRAADPGRLSDLPRSDRSTHVVVLRFARKIPRKRSGATQQVMTLIR
jgi:hypothetical protein